MSNTETTTPAPSVLSEMETLIRKKAAVQSWHDMRNLRDSQSGRNYSVVLRSSYDVLAERCGQAYAGASNYHPCPDDLKAEIGRATHELAEQIVQRAVAVYIGNIDTRLSALKASAIKALEAV